MLHKKFSLYKFFFNLQGRELQLHSLYPQHQLDVSGQLYAPATLISGKGPDFNRRNCLGPAPNLDSLKKKFSSTSNRCIIFRFSTIYMCINTFPFQIKQCLCLFLSQKTAKKVIRQQLFQENIAFDSLVIRLRRVHCPKPKAITVMKPNQTRHTTLHQCCGESCLRASTGVVQAALLR